jgi:type I restriction-modification system DNA methylase subunit
MGLIEDFMKKVMATYKNGGATEHSYRPALEQFLGGLEDDVTALNEPKRVECGAPDFLIQRGEIVIGHVEAKDIGVGLRNMKDANKNQQDRYRKALPNLIYTNCLDWDFYRDGESVASVTIADFLMGIRPKPERYNELENLLKNFLAQRPQTITSPRVLAEKMAGKAVLIRDILHNALKADKNDETELSGQYYAFKEHLIHDITVQDFADIYAETIAYGMFAARLHDPTLDDFSRQEALALLPKSNPFLRSLFGYIAGVDLDDRIAWIIDDLADVFQAANVKKIMEGFGSLTGKKDPFLHFYETFLAAYNPAKRKARGVWYTPEPVVNFIVRAVDEVLQNEFGLADGLADTSKVTIDWETGQSDKKGKHITTKKLVHRVQILDPATGTGTFLAEAIKQIAPKVTDIAEGMWSSYIEHDLIPRLHGFELLMASYAMCHMKLDMILTELGYKPTGAPPRLSVYLTNSLEEGEPANQTLLFAQWLSNEVKQANTIKRDMPIMCVIGNPPYNNSSKNQGNWIRETIKDYKTGLTEKKINLDDDYIKFIRLSQLMIEKNGFGVVAMITNNSYLYGVTHRRMRQSLLETFNKIFILNLHGDSNKKEKTPDGNPDANVFDIMQGVSIVILIKGQEYKSERQVQYTDLFGTRQAKYDALTQLAISSSNFVPITPSPPYFFFTPRAFANSEAYENSIQINKLMVISNTGVKTDRDELFLDFQSDLLLERFRRLLDGNFDQAFIDKYNVKDSGSFKITRSINIASYNDLNLSSILYRPFDNRHIYYDHNLVSRAGYKAMRHMLSGENYCLVLPKYANEGSGALVSKSLVGHKSYAAYEINYAFPLYLYPDEQDLDQTRRVNFEPKLFAKLQSLAKHPRHGEPDEVQVFDYIYGVLHCPAYREAYAEFLKIDFPRIPWPASPDEFWDVSAKGTQLRNLHLMAPAVIGPTPFPFKGEGNSVIEKPRHEDGKIWINKTQFFDNAPEVSWKFYIGGYQPAQKWLKDRMGRELSFDDVKHYQRVLKILSETDRIMGTINMTLGNQP